MKTINAGEKKKELNFLLKKYRKFQLLLTPQQNLLYGFLSYTLIGCLLLWLPLSQKNVVPLLDNLFIATSAISTTGLATVSVYDNYNFFGQFIILLLVQIGGIGYMTLTSFIVLSNHKLTHWHQRVLGTEFSLPKGFDLKNFLKSVIVFTIIIETLGAIAFFIAFSREGIETNFALWSSIFHSVSSFCTAGFGLYNNSFENFAQHNSLNIIISVLSILGSIGFIVVTDCWNRISGKTKSITFTSKVICLVTFLLIAVGTLINYFFEPMIEQYSFKNRMMISFFQTMSALTTVGFNTIPIGSMSLSALLLLTFLMYICASPSGTGGGMKSTTVTAIAAIVWNRIRGRKEVTFLGKIIPPERLSLAVSIFIFYTAILFLTVFLLSFTEQFSLLHLLFESASALGTVGLSMGITGSLSEWGKLILTCAMFVGRVGVITFGVAIIAKRNKVDKHKSIDDLAI